MKTMIRRLSEPYIFKITLQLFPSVCYFATLTVSCGMNLHSLSKDFVIVLSFKTLTGNCTRIYIQVEPGYKQTTCWSVYHSVTVSVNKGRILQKKK